MTDEVSQFAIACVALLTGLVIGSFLTVVVSRVPEGESIVRPRSRCPGCGKQIRAFDNIPVLSWILLRGKCRDCGEPISARYPLTELGNALLWTAAFLKFQDSLYIALVAACFFSVLLAVSLIDVERKIIPNRIVYPAVPALTVALVAGKILGNDIDLATAAIGFGAYGGLLLLVALVYPKGMGMGDVKLAALIGLVLGAFGLDLVVVAAALGVLLGGLGGILAMTVGSKGRKSAIPFGPFMASGAVLSVFFGAQIADRYLGLFG